MMIKGVREFMKKKEFSVKVKPNLLLKNRMIQRKKGGEKENICTVKLTRFDNRRFTQYHPTKLI